MPTEFLERLVWDQDDIEHMSWRECRIFAMAIQSDTFEVIFDAEYIYEAIYPEVTGQPFKIRRAPVTIVFENVRGLEFDFSYLETNISSLERLELDTDKARGMDRSVLFEWYFNCYSGNISVLATGFKVFVRKPPKLDSYRTLEERGGISFERSFTEC
ncbi:MAG: hypothetical protein SFV17_11060 [Candidatus Obscuribacter sp.]|nr:hypothetical protein [Candidatus Obscuribacter sp.]